MSHTHPAAHGQMRSTLVGTFGSDFRHLLEPFKSEISRLARRPRCDVHRIAMRLLLDYHGRRPTAMEQRFILAALAELQASTSTSGEPPPPAAVRAGDLLVSGRRAAPRARSHFQPGATLQETNRGFVTG